MFAIEQPGEYRTRDGRKAVILGYNPYGALYRRWIGYLSEYTCEWSDEGAYQPGDISDRDIVGRWEATAPLGRLVDLYIEQRNVERPDVTLEQVLRALAAEIDAMKAALGE
jgi:hypothetical protein